MAETYLTLPGRDRKSRAGAVTFAAAHADNGSSRAKKYFCPAGGMAEKTVITVPSRSRS
jgi:hypothetical protein